MNKKLFTYPLVVLSLIGIIFTYVLAQEHHFGAIHKKSGEKLSVFSDFSQSICGKDHSYMNCEKVRKSKYSKLFAIQMTSMGFVYFLLFMALTLFLLLTKEKLKTHIGILLFWFLCFGSLFDLLLLGLSVFAIKSICPICLITYGINWTSLVLIILYNKKSGINPLELKTALGDIIFDKKKLSFPRVIIVLSIIGGAIMVSFGINYYLKSTLEKHKNEKREVIINKILRNFSVEKRIEIDPPMTSIMGNPDAPITIVKFSDFLCPHCARTAEVVHNIILENPKLIKLIFVNYPLDISCNKYMKRQLHRGACQLAKGAICASRQGKFERYQEFAFHLKKKKVDAAQLKQLAAVTNLNATQFEQCMASPDTEGELLSHIEKAQELGVTGTPTLFINGKRYRSKALKELLMRVIEQEINENTGN